jgi:hypothetical protein
MADVVALTIPELAALLDPPITTQQLGHLVGAIGLEPSGKRQTGQRGRPLPTFDLVVIAHLHAAIVPWMPRVSAPA